MRIREIAEHAGRNFDVLIRMKLGPIIERNGFEKPRLRLNDLYDRLGCKSCGSILELRHPGKTCFPLNQGDDALMMILAHNGIALPMTELKAVVDFLGTR